MVKKISYKRNKTSTYTIKYLIPLQKVCGYMFLCAGVVCVQRYIYEEIASYLPLVQYTVIVAGVCMVFYI